MRKLDPKTTVFLFLLVLLCNAFGFAQDDDNGNDSTPVDTHSRIRLGFNAHNNFHRQILLGFENESATEGIDPGYDAINIFNLPDDIYFWCANTELSIQAVGNFNISNSYAIGIRSEVNEPITISIETVENMASNQNIYLYDNVTRTYTNLRTASLTVTVGIGTFNDRFSLKFINQDTLGTNNPELNNQLSVNYINNENSLSITNTLNDTIASDIYLFNITGQKIASWNIAKMDQTNLNIPVSGLSKGVYIINVITDHGIITKKINI